MPRRGRHHHLQALGSALHGVGMMVSFALLAVIAWGAVAPLESQQAADRERCLHLDRLIAGRPSVERQHAELKQKLESVLQRKEQLRRRITDGAREGEFLRQVSKAADETGVRLREFRPGAISRTGRYGAMRIELNCDGTYEAICRFLERLDQLPRLAIVERMEVSSPRHAASYSFKLSLDIYFASGAVAARPAREGDDV